MQVLAVLLGEADEAETEAIQQLLKENPDLQTYAEKMQKSLGLVEESAKSLWSESQTAPQQLSEDRRKALENLWNEEKEAPENVHSFPVEETQIPQKSGFQLHPFIPVAAAAGLAILIGGVWFPKHLKKKTDSQVAMSAQLPERRDALTSDESGSMPEETAEPTDAAPDTSALHFLYQEGKPDHTVPTSGKHPFADADEHGLNVNKAEDYAKQEALALKPLREIAKNADPAANFSVRKEGGFANDQPAQASSGSGEGQSAPVNQQRLEEMRKVVSNLSDQTRSLNLSVNELNAEGLKKKQDDLKSALGNRTTRDKKSQENDERSASKSLSRADNPVEMPAPSGRPVTVSSLPTPEPEPEVALAPKVLPQPVVSESVTKVASVPVAGGGKANTPVPQPAQPTAPPINAPVKQTPPPFIPKPLLPQEPNFPPLPGNTSKTQTQTENRRMPAKPFDDATETPPPAIVLTPPKTPAPARPQPTTGPIPYRTQPPTSRLFKAPAQPAASTPVPADPKPTAASTRLDDNMEKQKAAKDNVRHRQSKFAWSSNGNAEAIKNRKLKEKGLKDLELGDQKLRLESAQQGKTSTTDQEERLLKNSELAETKSDKEAEDRPNKRAHVAKLEKSVEGEEESNPDDIDKDLDAVTEDLGIVTPIALPEPKPEVVTAQSPFSTFSLNVTDASFRLCEASLLNGQLPPPHVVRAEEFINAFDYRDPAPTGKKALSFAWDRSRHPFAHNRDLVRFSIQTAAEGRQGGQPLNLVLTIDNSGSMERADRVAILQQALKVLSTKLRPEDKVSVIAFARTPRLWMNGVNGVEAGKKLSDFNAIVPQGGTNIEAALNLAYEVAGKHFIENGNNRVILLTDGAANLGNVVPKSLRKTVELQRKKAIALDCFGIGWDGYNDHLMEALARNGDGRYAFLNSPKDVERDFARKLAGALTLAAADVKVQVQFNPKRVKTHRQIGYLRHQLKKEDFRNNAVDAAEIGSAESGNAIYVLQIDPEGSGPIGTVHIRYRQPATGNYKETSWPLPHRPNPPALDKASSAMRVAASAATFAEWLARSPYAGDIDLMKLQQYLAGLQSEFPAHSPVQSLLQMIRAASISK